MSQYDDDADRFGELDEDWDMYLLWLDTGDGKPWVARISGTDKKFGLEREFIAFVDRKIGQRAYPLEEGVLYQVNPADGEERHFLMLDNNCEERVLTTEEAMELVENMDKAKAEFAAKSAGDLDNAILRVNAEGGYRLEPSDN